MPVTVGESAARFDPMLAIACGATFLVRSAAVVRKPSRLLPPLRADKKSPF